jgi:hypothetical protein
MTDSNHSGNASTINIAAFLTARVDEDRASANGCMNCDQPIRRATTKTGWTHGDRSAVGGGWQGLRCPGKLTGALPWPDPARVLREVEAKRAILAEHGARDGNCEICSAVASPAAGSSPVMSRWPCRTVRVVMSVYSDYPDFDPQWKA